MEKKLLIKILKKQKKDDLIKLLMTSFDNLSLSDQFQIFNEIYQKGLISKNNVNKIVNDIKIFYKESLSKEYYAPFDINSKNYMIIPEKTKIWCNKMADYYKKTIYLTNKCRHNLALECYDMLYYLENNMCEEIVFADELGSWMIPINQSEIMPKYVESISRVCKPEDFKNRIINLMEIDNYSFNKLSVYNEAIKIGTLEQKKEIKDLIKGFDK
ncbi:MAG: hypothetical protein A2086_14755 [Spirochaetes bacterium GWD1_27_9]|nr:MAG: hypothetical protein A2Z98_10035 [Spirochaetes bacterium GWB1_27_13]OHD21097.1 MAG: hypothetical protein A2Y34_06295 [Spirochaetes bacterium GWC1_27_15]OHD34756.1 MAG: hypothetical protein A2086_14755 [Spirochaetes bacterium GWD1_27_9]